MDTECLETANILSTVDDALADNEMFRGNFINPNVCWSGLLEVLIEHLRSFCV